MPGIVGRYDGVLDAADAPQRLWRRAVADVQAGDLDDRPLYWARLKLGMARRDSQGREAMAVAERQSRGFDTASRGEAPDVLVTGFDPFHLDRDIAQSNPSGLAALALDGRVVAGARVRAAILPVRFGDFDAGIVEDLLAPLFSPAATVSNLRLVVTMSMGRDRFDLERFPGRRRSATQPDNGNVYTGASTTNPLPPPNLTGPEYLEFSLPAAAMQSAPGRWPVRDNRRVQTRRRGLIAPQTLEELAGETAVTGSGGGYLSNEIAYRCLLLRRRCNVDLAAGHLHTPALQGYDRAMERDIVAQVRRILEAAVTAIGPGRNPSMRPRNA